MSDILQIDMPAKSRIKEYEAGGYYHIYNRGVARNVVFADAQDFAVWMSYLRVYLLPKNVDELQSVLSSDTSSWKEKNSARKLLRLNNFSDTIKLHAYCFLSNHFHMLIYQKEQESMDQFMNSLGTRYAMYFNKKYKRVGPLFQGVYKAVRVTHEEQLLYLTKYIHRNPDPDSQMKTYRSYVHSSYQHYIGARHDVWVDSATILHNARMINSMYQDFVEDRQGDEQMHMSLQKIVVDL